MELFSEIYGSYYIVLSRILEAATNGVTRQQMEEVIRSHGFQDSTYHLLPNLLSGEWNLLEQREKTFFSRMNAPVKRPWSTLERSWIKALLLDERIQLFLDEDTLTGIRQSLAEVQPLFIPDDFHAFDRCRLGDDYGDNGYIQRFKTVLRALDEHRLLEIEYTQPKCTVTKCLYHPYKLCYSAHENRFRLQCVSATQELSQANRKMLNLSCIISADITLKPCADRGDLDEIFQQSSCTAPVVLEIYGERNALERFMLQFASFERQTEYDAQRDIYTCQIWYDPDDEKELLGRILSFGPVVKVLEPEGFVQEIKNRILNQLQCLP